MCPGPLLGASEQPLPPSLQKEFFQDDVFPDTTMSWEPALSAEAWLGGANGTPQLLSLQPPGMTPGRMRAWAMREGRTEGRMGGQRGGWEDGEQEGTAEETSCPSASTPAPGSGLGCFPVGAVTLHVG